MSDSPYKMQLDLRVLDHLGLHLYSNAAAVLSEAVANAWDADAKNVSIKIDKDRIVIEDDGVGMALNDINDRFLYVGYDKRQKEGAKSPGGRAFMGRKGIGKLALFSIADVVAVITTKGSEHHAFRMETKGIEAAVSRNEEYKPVPTNDEPPSKGTRIILTQLKKKRTSQTVNALRKRIARRFSIIGIKSENGDSFDVRINDLAIGPADREDFKAIEFLWEFEPSERIPAGFCPGLKKRFLLPNQISVIRPDWIVGGWLGAASRPKKLASEDAGLMNGLVVIARGRLIQENILDKLGFNMLLGNYLTGQIEANFLDVESEEDIATSDRQRLMEDDERYVALRDFLRKTLVSISDDWTKLRNEARGKEAVEETPILGEWIDNLPEGQRDAARRTLGVILGVELESEEDRKDLYRSGMLAFERLRLKDASHNLGNLPALTAESLLPLLADLSMLEGSMYRDIVRARLDVIVKFEDLVDVDAKEKVLQAHLFENLWLLDPGWERAAGSERIEQTLKRDYKDFAADLTDDESKGRLDIRYKTNAGEHIIVELKRAGRPMKLVELQEQGQKYRTALAKCLKAEGNENPLISIIFVLGSPVAEEEESYLPAGYVTNTLQPLNARVMYYDQLIKSARDAYAEYLDRSKQVDRIDKFLSKLK
ncbi:ATP-binding protein [Methylomonas sp. LW13]|uniref:ATP-binding protein n=2 Tax=Methylomonas TaxID=416 RepID=A0ABU4U908_9GAMM|nr:MULTISPECIES: ATP-binding protein [unclassified Methylomonas]MCQ8181011.1 ATP-binding protein [Methylomonas sp. SURF-1]MDX8125911.1 ATP-binding protein [Methylomonas sp. OY6]QBC26016.1 ATP-binding protein [Methylomonas sp. LW13]